MDALKEDELRRCTKNYWNNKKDIDSSLGAYICDKEKQLHNMSLLKAELEFARAKGNIKNTPCKVLILLVGFSLEPLLQSICVYQPKTIVLLLNEDGYGRDEQWHTYAEHIVKAVKRLKEKGLIQEEPFFPSGNVSENGVKKLNKVGYPVQSSPESVFKTLIEVLRDEKDTKDVVIDVTGGKKSMVTGAYMYAAYAGVKISYVDFEDYDPEKRRPYGFSCKIGELANPYREFSLREWERVRELYNLYQFREARKLLSNEIKDTMKSVIPGTEEPMQKIATFLEYYEKWDSGDFRRAKEVGDKIKGEVGSFKEPSAVTELGDKWYEIKGSKFTGVPKHFYGNLQMVKLYVYDELKRIRRLIVNNQDYRSAFLRAGGVNEILMVTRLAQLAQDSSGRELLLTKLDKESPSIFKIFTVLLDCKKTVIDFNKDFGKNFGEFFDNFNVNLTVHKPKPINKWWVKTTKMFSGDKGWDLFRKTRNKLIHNYFSVPREWAEEALKFVTANFEDFLGQPMSNLPFCAEALPWSELCEMCGMDRFLPSNLRLGR
ncbi:CRISPR-associated protein Cas02710 [Thermincola potens]|uniref:CRISPR-associated protein Cas02710 n=1 Tax=Thermincola potens (strain JR) TaxID=635013 RepID=D5XAW4_THEPJ|nr:CRISPR-associated protein Cas02710 [Thermincola potens]ADG83318.1 CRISPR-associated protein Cas02710 [Thermincola potens JR]